MHAILAATARPQESSTHTPAEMGTGERTYPQVAGEGRRDGEMAAESRDRLRSVVSKPDFVTAEVVCAAESDVALMITVLRLANRMGRSSAAHSRSRRYGC